MKEARKKDCAAKSARDRTKENFTRKPMEIAAKFNYARAWLILPGMVKKKTRLYSYQ